MVTHLLGCAPFVVIAVINESSSSRFSFNFLTSDSIARLEKPSDSPPCYKCEKNKNSQFEVRKEEDAKIFFLHDGT
jgi:hypothetical protein